MQKEQLDALLDASKRDERLRDALASTTTDAEFVRVANDHGFTITVEDVKPPSGAELSDAELEGVSGGYTFPPTDWIYCDNPWTNAYCTLKC